MKREPVYMSDDYFLEKIYLPTKKMKGQKGFVYREVKHTEDGFEVKEYDNLPDWYIRHKKIEMILDV